MTDAATGRLSFASPLKGREPDIKAKGPEAALTASTVGKLPPAATTSAPTTASASPPTPHRQVLAPVLSTKTRKVLLLSVD